MTQTTAIVIITLAVCGLLMAAFHWTTRYLTFLGAQSATPLGASGRWATIGIGLLLVTVPITVATYNIVPDGPWPTYAFALPALPLVYPAWICFRRAGWGRSHLDGARGLSACERNCRL